MVKDININTEALKKEKKYQEDDLDKVSSDAPSLLGEDEEFNGFGSADESEIKIYEIGFHIVPSIEENTLSTEVGVIKSLIEKNGGVLISDEFPKKITLAYTISKNIDGKIDKFNTAYFGWLKFEIKTNNILNIKEGIDANKNIFRYLIIKTVKESTLTPKNISSLKTDTHKIKVKIHTDKIKESKKKELVSEEELDRTIEELVAE